MKKLILFTCLLTASVSLLAQPTKPATKPAAKPATKPAMPAVTTLKTLNDSASYAIGLSMANFYKQQGLPNLNTTLIAKACNDVYNNKPTLINEGSANEIMNKVMVKIQEEKVKP